MIVIDMTMPPNCHVCLFREHGLFSSEHRCVAARYRLITGNINEKPDWCPLMRERSKKDGADQYSGSGGLRRVQIHG